MKISTLKVSLHQIQLPFWLGSTQNIMVFYEGFPNFNLITIKKCTILCDNTQLTMLLLQLQHQGPPLLCHLEHVECKAERIDMRPPLWNFNSLLRRNKPITDALTTTTAFDSSLYTTTSHEFFCAYRTTIQVQQSCHICSLWKRETKQHQWH